MHLEFDTNDIFLEWVQPRLTVANNMTRALVSISHVTAGIPRSQLNRGANAFGLLEHSWRNSQLSFLTHSFNVHGDFLFVWPFP
jgi:hypothetical protein